MRNSRAETVVEGTGDHCCEYMTGGAVVCLGTAGASTILQVDFQQAYLAFVSRGHWIKGRWSLDLSLQINILLEFNIILRL